VCVLKTPILVKKKALVYLTKAVGKTIFFVFLKKLEREFMPGQQKSSKGPLRPWYKEAIRSGTGIRVLIHTLSVSKQKSFSFPEKPAF
jgi:hypothetical protein